MPGQYRTIMRWSVRGTKGACIIRVSIRGMTMAVVAEGVRRGTEKGEIRRPRYNIYVYMESIGRVPTGVAGDMSRRANVRIDPDHVLPAPGVVGLYAPYRW